ncbi:MAG: hypothetical protein ACE5H1_01905 [Thermodesulfobacteriota bacterium]
MPEYRLKTEIVLRSQSNRWETAKLEWDLSIIYKADQPESCLCGHFPIKEICVLRNRLNHRSTTVGNCCVKKFIGLPSDKIFQAVKKVGKDKKKSLNSETISYAYEKGWINNWEYNFSLNTMRKRNLSIKQLHFRKKINEKMLFNLRRSQQKG